MRAHKISIKNKLFLIILLILIVNSLVLLLAGSTLFENFYLYNKKTELLTGAQIVKESFLDGSDDWQSLLENVENKNIVIGIFTYDAQTQQAQYIYHTRPQYSENWDALFPKKDDQPKAQAQGTAMSYKQEDGVLPGINEDIDVFLQLEDEFQLLDSSPYSLRLIGRLNDTTYLYVETPKSYVKSTAELAVKYTSYISIIILLCGAIVVYFIVSRTTRPITQIQQVADKISHLDFSETCRVKSNDEIGMLAASINHMSSELQSNIQTLVKANEVLQKDLLQQQKNAEMRKQFVMDVSHDFKTPLALIVSYSEAISQTDDPDLKREYCDIIIQEGNKMSTLVAQLLRLSRFESGAEELNLSIFCLGDIVSEIVNNYHILAQNKSLHIVQKDIDAFIVQGDYSKIKQVFTNLYDNALKYTPENGTIVLKAQQEGSECMVSVENTGTHIAQEDLENLFISFYRADKSRTRQHDSYGLGLAIVKAVMEMHQKSYGAENTPNGVRFWFKLDIYEAEEPEESPEEDV